MDIQNFLLPLVGVLGCALAMAYVLRALGLPAAIAYIITGVMVGPSGLGWMADRQLLTHLGELGVIMLMFFIGMEVSLPRLVAGWRIAVLGTFSQMAISVMVCIVFAVAFGWPWQTGLLFGFILSLSSTAVVLTMLKDTNELGQPFGQNALSVLLMQDLAIVPIMIVVGLMGDSEGIGWGRLLLQVVGGASLIFVAVWLMRSARFHIPERLLTTVDKRVMLGLLLCFATASITAQMGLSAPMGAFLAGMVIGSTDQREWVHEHLRSLYVVFVATFFLSIGMLVDVGFVSEHLGMLFALTAGVFVLNSGINTVVLRVLGENWRVAVLTGGLLSQIGEFSFLLASLGWSMHIINDTMHHMTVAVIALTLLLSPFWVIAIRLMIREGTPIYTTPEVDIQAVNAAEQEVPAPHEYDGKGGRS